FEREPDGDSNKAVPVLRRCGADECTRMRNVRTADAPDASRRSGGAAREDHVRLCGTAGAGSPRGSTARTGLRAAAAARLRTAAVRAAAAATGLWPATGTAAAGAAAAIRSAAAARFWPAAATARLRPATAAAARLWRPAAAAARLWRPAAATAGVRPAAWIRAA